MQEFKLTDKAISKVQELLKDNPTGYFRVAIQGGGCVGLTYIFSIVNNAEETDQTFSYGTIKVAIDKKSQLYLNGSELDWEETLTKKCFRIKNPLQKSTCSCGESFSI